MADPVLTARIRTIFLHDGRHVSIPDAAAMLGWSRSELLRAIAAHEIDVTTTCAGKAVPIEEVVAKTLALWPLEQIEAALGKDAARVLPPSLRPRQVVAYLPAYQLEMLMHLASKRQTTVGHLIAHELDDLATEHLEELSARIPGFAEAFEWPHSEPAERTA